MIECVLVLYICFERSWYEEIANAKATCGKYNNYVLDKKKSHGFSIPFKNRLGVTFQGLLLFPDKVNISIQPDTQYNVNTTLIFYHAINGCLLFILSEIKKKQM